MKDDGDWSQPKRSSQRYCWIDFSRVSAVDVNEEDMIIPRDPRELAIDLLPRSTCRVQVAAVVADSHGIFGWGWNSMGSSGLGEHAEASAFRRANRDRLEYATLYVASRRQRNNKWVMSRPCELCEKLIRKYDLFEVYYLTGQGKWEREIYV